MVKRRGYRVELGEIESALYRHPHVAEAATVALPDPESGVLIKAFLSWSGKAPPSMIELKQFCASNLPQYMVPDRFECLDALPKTSTDKIDYQTLSRRG
jgi:acyl-coenzyme A synthetase/AMP-(fatty) acid ligase